MALPSSWLAEPAKIFISPKGSVSFEVQTSDLSMIGPLAVVQVMRVQGPGGRPGIGRHEGDRLPSTDAHRILTLVWADDQQPDAGPRRAIRGARLAESLVRLATVF